MMKKWGRESENPEKVRGEGERKIPENGRVGRRRASERGLKR